MILQQAMRHKSQPAPHTRHITLRSVAPHSEFMRQQIKTGAGQFDMMEGMSRQTWSFLYKDAG
jgi:hypothetical protein